MQTYTQTYHDAISSTDREIRGYIKFNGTFVLDGAGGLISFKTTQNAMDAERFCVGSVCSAMCEATFYNEGLEGSGVSLANSYFDAYIGVVTDAANDTVEYVCCGRYYVSEITRSTATTKIVGYDIAGRLSMDYVPTVTADPDHGYLVMDILNDIIDQTGVNGGDPFTTFGDSTYVPEIYLGNCRAQWGWLCSLVDGTASNYSGTREPADLGYIKTYVAGNGVATPYAVGESTTYMDGLSLGDAYTITSFTSGTTDEPIVVGNGTGLYGLNPYMTTAVATTIEGTMDGYQYYPATLHWRGDPCLDILDEINVTKGTDTYKIVVMKIETTFNGGLEQTISCFGDSEAYYALSTSPTQGAINRVSNLVQDIQQAIETADNGVCTKILDTDGTWKEFVIANNQDLSQATSVWRFNINGLAHSNRYQGGTYTLAMDTQGRIVANVIQTGVLQDALGNNSWNLDTGALTITNGSINITTNSASYDIIELNAVYSVGGETHTASNKFQPIGLRVTDAITGGATYETVVQATSLIMQNLSSSSPSPFLYISPQAGQVTTTGVYIAKDSSGNNRVEVQAGGVNLKDTSNIYRTKIQEGTISLYDTNSIERVRETVDGISVFNSSGTEQTKIRNTASSSWYTGRYYASLISKVAPSSMGTYLPITSVKAYSSDWAIGTLSNHLYFVNTTDSAYNNGRNYYLKYELEYADTSGGAQSYSILTTKNTDDRVIAHGSSGVWRYRKWASGWLECWGTIAIAEHTFQAWGSYGYYSTEVGKLNYPVAFSGAPYELATPLSGNAWVSVLSSSTQQTATKCGGYRAYRPVSGNASFGVEIYAMGTAAS